MVADKVALVYAPVQSDQTNDDGVCCPLCPLLLYISYAMYCVIHSLILKAQSGGNTAELSHDNASVSFSETCTLKKQKHTVLEQIT